MRSALQSRQMVYWTAALLLASLLAGCVGQKAIVWPWSPTQASPESRLEHVSTANFNERVLKCEKTVLVDFYAEWCGPCKKLGPVLEEFAQAHPEVRVVKVNVDENSDLTARYGVKAMPTLLVLHHGQVAAQSTGVVTKEYLAEMTKEKSKQTAAL